MNTQADLRQVPAYVTAKSAQALRLECYKNNLRMGGEVRYFDIQFIPHEKIWYAFFYDDFEKSAYLKDKVR